MRWPDFTTTEWILLGGFGLIYASLVYIYNMLKDIHAELLNIESNTSAPRSAADEWDDDHPSAR